MAAGMFWLSLAVVLLTLSVSCPATAADVSSGLALAEKNCERCHAIGKTGKSKHAEAPPFGEVVTRYPPASLAEALAEGISTGHRDMPEFVFSPDEFISKKASQLIDAKPVKEQKTGPSYAFCLTCINGARGLDAWQRLNPMDSSMVDR